MTWSESIEIWEQAVRKWLKSIIAVSVVFVLVAAAGHGVRVVARWLLEREQVTAALAFVAGCGLVFYWLLSRAVPKRERGDWLRRAVALGFITAAAFLWVYLFGVFSYGMVHFGWVSYPGLSQAHALEELTDAYFWHLLELIPLLQINEALSWNRPAVDLTGGGSGAVLLLFRIVMLFQVFEIGRRLLKAGHAPAPGSASA